MSVNTYNRSRSRLEAQYRVYEVYQEILKFSSKLLVKYRIGSGDKLQNLAIDTIAAVNLVNSINSQDTAVDLYDRRYAIAVTISQLDTLSIAVSSLVSVCMEVDGVDRRKQESLIRLEERIGKKCYEAVSMLVGLAQSDIRTWNKRHPSMEFDEKSFLKAMYGDTRYGVREARRSAIKIGDMPLPDKQDVMKCNQELDRTIQSHQSQLKHGSPNIIDLDNLPEY